MDIKNNPDVVLQFTGIKTKNGMPVKDKKGKPVIAKIIGVKEKKDPRKVDPNYMIPKFIQDTPTDVIQAGIIKKLEIPETMSPLVAGCSISRGDGTRNTLGLFCHACDGGYAVYSYKKKSLFSQLGWLNRLIKWFLELFFEEEPEPKPEPEPEDDCEDENDDDEEHDRCPYVPNENDCKDCPYWSITDCWYNIECPETPNEKDCQLCFMWDGENDCWYDVLLDEEDEYFDDTPETPVVPSNKPIHNNIFILSCNHSLADEDRCQIGDPIYQCGMYDCNKDNPNRIIGELVAYAPIEGQDPFTVDAAICSIYLDEPIEYKQYGLELYKTTTACAKIGDKVYKVGSTTGFTDNGEVIGIDGESWVEYYERRLLSDQIVISGYKFSEGGDSGSVIFNSNGEIIGLLCAGSDEITLANKIENVQKKLNIKF